MITDDRITSYIHSLAGNDSDICMQIEHEALSEGVPIIRKEMGCFLKTILAEKHPKNILEVGAAVGLSLIHISEPTRRTPISYAVFCLKKKKKNKTTSESPKTQ